MKLMLFKEAHALCCHVEVQGISFFSFLKLWKSGDHVLDVINATRVFTPSRACQFDVGLSDSDVLTLRQIEDYRL